jgi:hypothetical protein
VVDILVAQTGAERFEITLLEGRRAVSRHVVTLPRHTRRGLGLHGVPPSTVVEEGIRFLLERLPAGGLPAELSLPAEAGRFPEWVEELRVRCGR